MRVRRRRFERQPQRQRRLARPVISVGNLSVGGTGKTPVVAAIAQWLIAEGHRPAILSRGYARADNVDGVVVVSDGESVRATVDESGDEPLMLAEQVPGAIVCVSPERDLSGTLAEQRLGATVHVLADGFQHLELARDVDVLVTTIGEIPNGRVIPFGRLREPADAAARAQVLVVSDANAGAASAEAWTLGISQSCGALRRLGRPVAVFDDPADVLEDCTVLAVAGIAHPDRFVAALNDAGWNVAGQMAFRDHHRYTTADAHTIAAKAASCGADVVLTTSKDAVRLAALGPTPFGLFEVPLTLSFDPPDALFATVKAAL
ncbi:MAG: tetraacyldisaccharide 4'-kinase [Acidimicrobiia bacterium]